MEIVLQFEPGFFSAALGSQRVQTGEHRRRAILLTVVLHAEAAPTPLISETGNIQFAALNCSEGGNAAEHSTRPAPKHPTSIAATVAFVYPRRRRASRLNQVDLISIPPNTNPASLGRWKRRRSKTNVSSPTEYDKRAEERRRARTWPPSRVEPTVGNRHEPPGRRIVVRQSPFRCSRPELPSFRSGGPIDATSSTECRRASPARPSATTTNDAPANVRSQPF